MLPIRKQIRLPQHDYSSDGWYYITICAKNHLCLFGQIQGQKMHNSVVGQQALKCWLEIPEHYKFVKLDHYVVMPNHIHGIIGIRRNRYIKTITNLSAEQRQEEIVKSASLSNIVGLINRLLQNGVMAMAIRTINGSIDFMITLSDTIRIMTGLAIIS